jgi:hypothetical protein
MSEAHAAFRAECHIRLPGGVLVLAPPGAFGLGAVSVASVADGPGRLRLMAGHAEAFARLRADWVGLGLPGLPGRLSDTELLALLESAIASRRLAVAFFPRPVDPLDRLAADTIPRQPAPAAPVAAKSVRDMSRSERVEAALKRVPAHLTGELKNAFLGLISPTSIGITVAAFAGLAVAQFFGYGEAADAVLAAIAYGIAGLSGVRALYDMVAATVDAATATTDAEIEAAAVRLANAFVVLGMAFLTIFITRAARKAAQARAAKPPEPPAEKNPGTSSERPTQKAPPSRSGPLYDDPNGAVRTRVGELQEQIPENSRGRITMGSGVVEDASGDRSMLISTSEPRGYLRPGVTLNPGETMVSGTGHAEADIASYAVDNDLTLVSVGATRPVCAGCQSVLGPTGADIATPLK